MTKQQLQTTLVYVANAREKNFSIQIYYPCFCDVEQFIVSASGSAGVKLIKGKISLKSGYLISRGRELPLKPSAIVEYSSHWPYDFCYFYKL